MAKNLSFSSSRITVNDILSSSGRYPDRVALASVSDMENAATLAYRINELFKQIDYRGSTTISSGFRPAAVNASTPGAAKKSLHMKAMAADFQGQELGLFIRKHLDGATRLRQNGLFMEALDDTPRWTHIDWGMRTDRANREFKP